MLLINVFCVSGLDPEPPADGLPACGRTVLRHVQFLAHDAQAGAGNLATQPAHRDLLQQVIFLDDAVAGVTDERVLVRRLLERPRRVTRQEAERAERAVRPMSRCSGTGTREPGQVRARE